MNGTAPGARSTPGSNRRRPHRSPHWLLEQLPPWMRDDDFLTRFVSVFEEIATTHVEHIDQLEHIFDRTVAPPAMARALGRCVGVDVLDPTLPEALQREVLLEMRALARSQGTRQRLTRLLELVTMAPVEVVDSGRVSVEGDAPLAPPHVRIVAESAGWMDRDDLVGLVRRELPASVTFELWLSDERLWPESDHTTVDAEPAGCPECGAPTDGVTQLMDADGFCRTCDFPLFWGPGARRRSPIDQDNTADVGTDAVRQLTSVGCPGCGRVTDLDVSALRTARGFCPGCDFPLWWAMPVDR
jgi:phage tail-like protein